ncbi:hypothetical protein H6F43_13070 [Leptolyngbya sp. FACHB-36]|uniref:DUF7657 domain-containing protein n=1 Tax=Leptolyngbya sp. FACHB-36 TaxID=2692808 RepID=UPI0016811728|nr:hypothetical protein [Leptolyngbya sp. FACHB-36]MBD2021112.1 hypothetical protein [Leptolyngbya sp. FACHB-36]
MLSRMRRLGFTTLLVVFLFTGGIVYIAGAWSPSSYAIVLEQFGVKKELVHGKPRPIRSDEWTVATPLTQATVNNQFQRYNQTSPYNEDLRIYISLPIADWGLLFKPDLWLYRLVNPAYAFSFHHYIIFAIFIIGYYLLFCTIGITKLHALLLSAILFFTGYVQYWWTILGPGYAFFPWIIVVLTKNFSLPLRLGLFYWISTSWMISVFYPPLFISLAFVGFIVLLAFHPHQLKGKTLVALGITGIASVGTVIFYLRDYLLATASTVYPGQRVSSGGSVVFEQWISQFLPVSQIYNHDSLIGRNICEISTIGAFYTLAVLVFLDYGKWQESGFSFKRGVFIVTGGILATWAWILLPLPSWVGALLLWNRIPPVRMFFAAGLLLLLLVAFLAQKLGIKVTLVRVSIFVGMTVLSWVLYKAMRSYVDQLDLVILLPILLLAVFAKRITVEQRNTALLVAALFCGFLAFGSFNPVQSAWLVFNRPQTSVTLSLDAKAAEQSNRLLAVEGFPGAILNGWGYRSISHVLPTPHLGFFRKIFPELPETEFQRIFNRYAHINLIPERQPRLLHEDAVGVPIDAFKSR